MLDQKKEKESAHRYHNHFISSEMHMSQIQQLNKKQGSCILAETVTKAN